MIGGLPRGAAAANLLRLGAIPLDAHRAPWLYAQVAGLAARAGVRAPALFLLRAPQPNALTIGTRDPRGLASALDSLEQRRHTWWQLMFGYRPAPARGRLTDSHPPTRERVARLLALAGHGPTLPTRARTIPIRAL